MKYENIWKHVDCPLTKVEYMVIDKEFYLWAIDKAEDFLLEWYKEQCKQELEREAIELAQMAATDCPEEQGVFDEVFKFYMKAEKGSFVDIPEMIQHINQIGYQQYLKEEREEHLEYYLHTTNLYCPSSALTLKEKVVITPLLVLFDKVHDLIRNSNHWSYSPFISSLSIEIAETLEKIKQCEYSTETLRVSNELYRCLSNEVTKVEKKVSKKIEKQLEVLTMMHEYLTNKGFPELDIYKKCNRMPGAGWSKQK